MMLVMTAVLRSLGTVGLGLYIQSNQIHGTNKHNSRLRVYNSVRSAAVKFLNDDVHPTSNDFDAYLIIYQALMTGQPTLTSSGGGVTIKLNCPR